MRKFEIELRQQFTQAAKGDLKTARLLVQMATDYFAPDADPPFDNEFITEAEAKRRFGRNWINIMHERNEFLLGSAR